MALAASHGHQARDWENPAVIGINKRRPHVPLRSFTASEQAVQHYRLRSGKFDGPPDFVRSCRAALRAPPIAAVAVTADATASPSADPPFHQPAETCPSPRIISLNSDAWRFHLFDRPEAVPAAFSNADFDASQWDQARSDACAPTFAASRQCLCILSPCMLTCI